MTYVFAIDSARRKGKVKVFVMSEQGKEAVVALHGKGDFFGEGCLTVQPLCLATVAAMTDCVSSCGSTRQIWCARSTPSRSCYILARNARDEEDLVDPFSSTTSRSHRVPCRGIG